MCIFSSTPDVEQPQRYAQQRTPTRRDTGDARQRAEARRRRATGTLLTTEVQPADDTARRTLLGS